MKKKSCNALLIVNGLLLFFVSAIQGGNFFNLFTLSDAWVRICGVCALAIAFCMTFWCVRRKKESES
ncbi:MAG: hypothetical protein K6F51_10730 [Acetatifactor sp.]|jgi:uncharacterized protein YjeT (DUF2065 family)|nr:hypothetical protein [Acetatifactor sp.]